MTQMHYLKFISFTLTKKKNENKRSAKQLLYTFIHQQQTHLLCYSLLLNLTATPNFKVAEIKSYISIKLGNIYSLHYIKLVVVGNTIQGQHIQCTTAETIQSTIKKRAWCHMAKHQIVFCELQGAHTHYIIFSNQRLPYHLVPYIPHYTDTKLVCSLVPYRYSVYLTILYRTIY